MKNYEITFDAKAVVLVVAAEDEDDAYDCAEGELTRRSFKILDRSIREVADGHDLERTRAHADEVSEE